MGQFGPRAALPSLLLLLLLTHSLTILFPQQAPDVATVLKATKHIVNNLKQMSSEELTKTADVLQNVKQKIENFNTSKREAEELITVKNSPY